MHSASVIPAGLAERGRELLPLCERRKVVTLLVAVVGVGCYRFNRGVISSLWPAVAQEATSRGVEQRLEN